MLITITGPTCSGKSTLEKEFVSRFNCNKITSFTTRPMRNGEVDTLDYFFLKEPPPFSEVVEQVEYNGNYYGIMKSEVEKARGAVTVVVVEPHGVQQVESYCAANDIKIFKVFVDQALPVLVERFLRRSCGDIASNLKLSDYYAQRLISLIHEHETWYNPLMYDALLTGDSLVSQLRNYLINFEFGEQENREEECK
jgi:guanylate kinase